MVNIKISWLSASFFALAVSYVLGFWHFSSAIAAQNIRFACSAGNLVTHCWKLAGQPDRNGVTKQDHLSFSMWKSTSSLGGNGDVVVISRRGVIVEVLYLDNQDSKERFQSEYQM